MVSRKRNIYRGRVAGTIDSHLPLNGIGDFAEVRNRRGRTGEEHLRSLPQGYRILQSSLAWDAERTVRSQMQGPYHARAVYQRVRVRVSVNGLR